MKTERVNKERLYAKLLALSIIYEKGESCRKEFLEKITYTRVEINAVLDEVSDFEFRSWIETVIPVMQYRKRE